jgi:hypothetical protein
MDPVKYAEAFGAKGLMIQSPDEIPSVLPEQKRRSAKAFLAFLPVTKSMGAQQACKVLAEHSQNTSLRMPDSWP